MSSVAPQSKTLAPQPKKVGLGRSILWSLVAVAALPVAGVVAWLVGLGGSKARDLLVKLNITWGQIWTGIAILAAYALVVTVIHTVRKHRAQLAAYTDATATLAPDVTTEP